MEKFEAVVWIKTRSWGGGVSAHAHRRVWACSTSPDLGVLLSVLRRSRSMRTTRGGVITPGKKKERRRWRRRACACIVTAAHSLTHRHKAEDSLGTQTESALKFT